MGQLVDGKWHTDDTLNRDKDGRYLRQNSPVRNWLTPDGAPGPSGRGGFKAEAGRYHLYIAIGCPWAHRTQLVRAIKGLEDVVSMSTVTSRRSDQGWTFDNESEQFRDALFGKNALHEIYTLSEPAYNGRVTVPVLWDKAGDRMVNNESSEIIRMFGSAFDGVGGDSSIDLYPEALRDEIDANNARIYETVNNGVYRAGFATSQEAYEEAVDGVFETLDMLEERLATRRYLAGDRLTEADWRLFPTLARFDVAYVSAFKCNKRRIVDYPNLWAYTRELYQMPGIAETVQPDTYKRGYHSISQLRNPTGIVPKGPVIDFTEPHERGVLAAA